MVGCFFLKVHYGLEKCMLNPTSANQCLELLVLQQWTSSNLSHICSSKTSWFFSPCGRSLGAALGTLQLVSALCLLAQRREVVVTLLPWWNGFNVMATGAWGQWSVFCLGLFLNTRDMVSLLVLASFQVHAILHLKIFRKSWSPHQTSCWPHFPALSH